MTNARHAAVVLAAGGSRRLGRSKQLLTRDGETLLHRVVRLVQETDPDLLVVVLGANFEQHVAAIADMRCEIAHNPLWRKGIGSSLARAAELLSTRARQVLIAGCDQPALTAEHLLALVNGASTMRSGCAATLHSAGPGVPVMVPTTMLSASIDPDADMGLGKLLRQLPPDSIFPLAAPELQHDLDTPAQVQCAIKSGWLDG